MEILRLRTVPSTQQMARELVFTGHPLPVAVVADTQSAGRGRLGKSWKSEIGGLWLSIATPVPSACAISTAALVAASTVARFVTARTGLNVGVKWPNDLLIDRRKVCGILAECLIQSDMTVLLLGVGLNVNNPMRSGDLVQATSLTEELGHDVLLAPFVSSLAEMIGQDVESLVTKGFESFLPWMRSHLLLVNQVVTVEFNGERQTGSVSGLTDTGSLLLSYPDGTTSEVSTGTVESW